MVFADSVIVVGAVVVAVLFWVDTVVTFESGVLVAPVSMVVVESVTIVLSLPTVDVVTEVVCLLLVDSLLTAVVVVKP